MNYRMQNDVLNTYFDIEYVHAILGINFLLGNLQRAHP